MSDETTESTGPGFLDHLFNAFGHIARAQRKQAAEKAPKTSKGKTGSRKFKAAAFDEAPPADDCCIAKRGG